MSERTAGAGLDAGLAVATAAAAVQLAIRTAVITGDEVPAWAGTVAGLLEGWSQQLGQGGPTAGQVGAVRVPGASWRTSRAGAPAEDAAPAALLFAHPLLTWLRLRFGIRRCLACGWLGQGSLEPASPLVPPARARTWRCADRLACRRRRIRREGRR